MHSLYLEKGQFEQAMRGQLSRNHTQMLEPSIDDVDAEFKRTLEAFDNWALIYKMVLREPSDFCEFTNHIYSWAVQSFSKSPWPIHTHSLSSGHTAKALAQTIHCPRHVELRKPETVASMLQYLTP
jgi:hypothetical protein